jgi:SWIM zinc finger
MWTVQRVEQLAADAAAMKAAHGLAKPAKWRNLGRSESVVWGECQGSGAHPYQVRVDLDDVAYKCSCPSRKLPCKHTLGLLLLLADGMPFGATVPPEFVSEWSANRAKRAEKRAAPEKPPDPAAQAKRIEKREARIDAGLEQLQVWLDDLMLHGLAAAHAQPPSFWEQMAARLVDAQAPGLARRVRDLGERAVAARDWQPALLAGLARLQLLVDAYRRLEVLPAELVAEIRGAIGWTQSQDALLEQAGVRDRWHVVGRRQSESEAVRTQLTWLIGADSARVALVLEFAVGREPLPTSFALGQVFDAELVFYEGVPPLRAIVKTKFAALPAATGLPFARDAATVQSQFAEQLALNPWLEHWPTVLGPVVPHIEGARCVLVDDGGRGLPLRPQSRYAWPLLALASGEPLTLFGVWDGRDFDPISIAQRGALYVPAAVGSLAVLSRVA